MVEAEDEFIEASVDELSDHLEEHWSSMLEVDGLIAGQDKRD